MSSTPWPSKAETPPIFADLILDTPDGMIVIDVERAGWIERARGLQGRAWRAGLAMRDSGEVAAWVVTGGGSFECFSRVTGRISPNGHTQSRRACIRCDGAEVWVDDGGNVTRHANKIGIV